MIGITGVATSGKDTLYLLLKKYFEEKGLKVQRYALADLLKKDLEKFVLDKFNLNIFELSKQDKELLRPVLVAYGKIKRINSSGRHWIDQINHLLESRDKATIPIITDIRYQEYEKDEAFWLKKENKGILIHISRIYSGKLVPPANQEEMNNDKILKKESDYSLIWCTENNPEKLYKDYEYNFKEIYELYRSRL